MKFKPITDHSVLDDGVLKQDFAQARSVGKVRLGEECLYFSKFSGVSYLPYHEILRAWLRQEEVKARLCCGTANFDQFYVVLACAGGREYRGQVIDKSAGQACLDQIAAKNPEVRIGFVKPEQ